MKGGFEPTIAASLDSRWLSTNCYRGDHHDDHIDRDDDDNSDDDAEEDNADDGDQDLVAVEQGGWRTTSTIRFKPLPLLPSLLL